MSQTVIVLKEDCVLAAVGKEGKKPMISRVKKIPLQGQDDAFERWHQALLWLKREWNIDQVRLILPAGMCSARVLTVPSGSGKQFSRLAKREVAERFRNEIADYTVIYEEKKAQADLCAGGVEQETLERFVEMCQKLEISVKSVTVPMEGYLSVLRQMDSYWKQTAIFLFFEEGSMTSLLCQNGRYLYSSRSRLFSEAGTLDFGTEIVRSISGILQFYSGTKREQPITNVYYAGCPESDFEVSNEGIEALKLHVFPMEPDLQSAMPGREADVDWLDCIGALMRRNKKEKRIDLLSANEAWNKKEGKSQGIVKHLLWPALMLALCLLAAGVVGVMNLLVSRSIHGKERWLERSEIQEKYAYVQALDAELLRLRGALTSVEQMEQNLMTYPEFSSRVLQQIQAVGGGQMRLLVTDFDAASGVLIFDASNREIIDVPSYILQLQETGLFEAVNYTGYALEEEWYTLSLSCVMKGNHAAQTEMLGGTQ